MKKMMKRLTAFALTLVMVCGMMPLASAVTLTPISIPGWEDWKTEVYQFFEGTDPKMYFTCPKTDVTDEEIIYYVGKLMSEIDAIDREYWLFFPQPTWNDATLREWFSRNGGSNSKRWLVGDSYVQVTCYFEDNMAQMIVRPTSQQIAAEVVDKVKEVGESAKAASTTVRGQLEYINNWLCDNMEYDYDGNPKENEAAYNAFILGKGVCNDYAVATRLLCNYLNIPNELEGSSTHVWNTVCVEGAWKHLDVTWNDTNSNRQKYFLVDDIVDKEGVTSHKYDKKWLIKRQTATLALWDGLTAPMRSVDTVSYLTERGVLRGDQTGNLNLNASLTRAELATILTRINGAEDTVMEDKNRYTALCTFADVPDWAKPYVGYCVEQGLVQGYNATTYGASDPVTPAAACTVILRHMGYGETDWNYNTAVSKAASVGLVSQYWPTGTVALRNDIAALAYAALTAAK